MAIDLLSFGYGDLDYINKLNSNMAALESAITSLEGAVSSGGSLDDVNYYEALFQGTTTLIGFHSYEATSSGTTLTLAPGGAYRAVSKTVVKFGAPMNINFYALQAAYYYIDLDQNGIPIRTTEQGGASIYSVEWRGTSFGGILRLVKAMFDAEEEDSGRISSTSGPTGSIVQFPSLDARFEAVEATAKVAYDTANEAADAAQELQAKVGHPVRKIGITVDGTPGVKGAIQIDFNGIIIGWSCIADTVGDLAVEVSVAGSSPPSARPSVPDPALDKISGIAPIILQNAQSASAGTSGVSAWIKDLTMWDVVQFSVAASSVITRATIYLRIQEVIVYAIQLPTMLELPAGRGEDDGSVVS